MAIEPKRGCGYRRVGGLYLCGSGISISCDRLPYELHYCPTCGSGLQFSRNFQWLDWLKFAGEHSKDICVDKMKQIMPCYVCQPQEYSQPYGILWVGEAFYTPQSFIKEALELGVSKRIPFIPKELKLGETIVLFAHKKGVTKQTGEDNEPEYFPAVFYAFKPQRIEMPIYEKDLTGEKREELEKRGVIPIPIPDGDIDHSDSNNVKMGYDPKTKRFGKVMVEED